MTHEVQPLRDSDVLQGSVQENVLQAVRDLAIGEFDVKFETKPGPTLGDPTHVAVVGRRSKVCIVGFAETTKQDVPYADESFEVWSLNQHYRFMPRATRWFEIHTRKQYTSDIVPGTDYVGWLTHTPLPIYVTELCPDMPTAIPFPMDAYVKLAGVWEEDIRTGEYHHRDYTQSSLALMLALALIERFDTIHIYGVDLVVGAEYFYQKPNMEWLIGVAQGMGYTVTRGSKPRNVPRELFIPRRSALLRQLYSYGPAVSGDSNPMPRLMRDRLVHLNNARDTLITQLNNCDGCINETKSWLEMFEMHEKGGVVGFKFSDGHTEQIEPF